jgi:hypothetical protein
MLIKHSIFSFLVVGLLAGSAWADSVMSLEEKYGSDIQMCGMVGTVDARIKDCEAKNETTYNGHVLLNNLRVLKWALVMHFDYDFYGRRVPASVYQDKNPEGLLWTNTFPVRVPLWGAQRLCSSAFTSLDKSGFVPSPTDYSGAEKHSIREVLSMEPPYWIANEGDEHQRYWTSQTFERYETEMATYFNGEDGSVDDYQSQKANLSVRCAAKP